MSVKWIWLTAALITIFLFNALYFGVFNGNELEAASKAQTMMTSIQDINVLSPITWVLYVKSALLWDYTIFTGILSWFRFLLIAFTAPPIAWVMIDIFRAVAFGLSSITSWFRW